MFTHSTSEYSKFKHKKDILVAEMLFQQKRSYVEESTLEKPRGSTAVFSTGAGLKVPTYEGPVGH